MPPEPEVPRTIAPEIIDTPGPPFPVTILQCCTKELIALIIIPLPPFKPSDPVMPTVPPPFPVNI